MDVVNKVSFVNKISMLMKATSDDDKPIPGYLYDEVNKISLESTGYCLSLLEFLVSQLEKRSCHTKLKVLKLMAFLVEKGHPDFRHGLRRQANGIKEATKFSGPPDQLHGNVPYLMVRHTAQSLSEVLFDAEYKTDIQAGEKTAKSPGSVPTGMGNIQGRSKMEGFGNSPQHQPKSTGQILRDSLGNFLDKLTDSTQTNQTFITEMEKQPNNFAPVKLNEQMEVDMLVEKFSKALPPVRVPQHVPGRAGGGWDEDEEEVPRYRASSSHTSSKDMKGSTEIVSDRRDSEEYSLPDWSGEDQLVSEMVENTRPLPTRADLETFITSCSSLNCDKVLDLINQQLQSDRQPHSQLMCLFMLEWLSRTDLVNLNVMAMTCKANLINVYNSTPSDTSCDSSSGVSNSSNSNEQLVRSKARKIIRILEKLTSYKNILPHTNKPKSDNKLFQELTFNEELGGGQHLVAGQLGGKSTADGKENILNENMTKSIFDFIQLEEEKMNACKSTKENSESLTSLSPKQLLSESPTISPYSKTVFTDNELSDASSQPSVGSEFSLLNEDSLETNEG